ncbi:metalloregulator ArsR/SmtB family transcription factor [bacterium]|nr:metalloregulator ArsR/SmtB family transcription factor [bacterium]
MRIKKADQILKSFADETRLRVINLLSKHELNVTELCEVLQSNQSNLSKHLTRLRLTGVVCDRKDGLNVYYQLIKPEGKAYKELLRIVTVGLDGLETFKQDLDRLKEIRKIRKNTNAKGGDKK